MKNKTMISLLLCLVLCASLFAFPAFAEQTVIIVGGALQQNGETSTSGSQTVLQSNGGDAGTVVISGSNNAQIQPSSPANTGISGSVVIMPNGAIQAITGQQTQQQTQTQNQIIYTSQVIQTSSTQVAEASTPIVVSVQAKDSTQTVASSDAPNDLAMQLLTVINETRAAYGLSALSYSSALQGSADTRAKESVTNFSHLRPDGSGCETAVTVDYMVTGENLIQMTSELATAPLMVDTWMNSPTHRNNLLLASFSEMAVGIYVQNGTTYVSTIFAGY